MYEETDRCPHCGHYAGEPIYGASEEFPWTGGGSSSVKRLPFYYMTRGPMTFTENRGFIMTVNTYDEIDYRG